MKSDGAAHPLFQFGNADADLMRHIFFRCARAKALLRVMIGLLEFALSCAHRAWLPIERAEVIQHCALDAAAGVRLELHPTAGIKAVGGFQKPDESHLN